jgi:hypothetical protein
VYAVREKCVSLHFDIIFKNTRMNTNEKSLSFETFVLALKALALTKAVRDLVLTDEQKSMIPELFKKHAIEIAKPHFVGLGLSEEEFSQMIEQIG